VKRDVGCWYAAQPGDTRGKRLVVLIGQPKACALAVRNVRAMQRLTNLAARLRQQNASGSRTQ
jgi:ATP-dependent exoDNAse (exonuclease V) alpha subunit